MIGEKPLHAINKTFRLSLDTVTLLDLLVERFSQEANFQIGASKVVELALFHLKDKHLKQLL